MPKKSNTAIIPVRMPSRLWRQVQRAGRLEGVPAAEIVRRGARAYAEQVLPPSPNQSKPAA